MLQKLIYSIFFLMSSNFSNFYVLFIFRISFGRTCYGTTVVSESWCQSDQGTGSRLPKLPTSTADAVTRSPCGQRRSRCSFLAPSLRPPPKRSPRYQLPHQLALQILPPRAQLNQHTTTSRPQGASEVQPSIAVAVVLGHRFPSHFLWRQVNASFVNCNTSTE